MTKGVRSDWCGCPTRYAAGIIGDRWCFLLLRDVLLHGKRHYGEFLGSEEGISTNILADRLARLEAAGLFEKRVDPRKRSRGIYLPTAKAKALLPALIEMMVWSTEYDQATEAPESFAKAWRDDRQGTLDWYRAEIDRVDSEVSGR